MEPNGEVPDGPQPDLTPGDFSPELSAALESMYSLGVLARGELDARAMDAIKELPSKELTAIFEELKTSNLEHVSNKSAFVCGLIKTTRQKARKLAKTGQVSSRRASPDDAKLKEILERTGYPLDVSTGQRKYGGPPPNWEGQAPGDGHEIYCGHIPKDLFEDTLIPLFEKYGTIWDLRLMMDPITGRNRGYCFVTYTEKKSAEDAVKGTQRCILKQNMINQMQCDRSEVLSLEQERLGKNTMHREHDELNTFEIRMRKRLRVNVTSSNNRLFVGNIPKTRSREELLAEFQKHTEGLVDVIVYSSPDDEKKKNRGFAFLDFTNHKMATAALRHMTRSRLQVWDMAVVADWAHPLDVPDEETMAKVKVLYVHNLKHDTTEAQLQEKFESYGPVERVKKVKGYAFVHFADREAALRAQQELDGTELSGSKMDISLAKPMLKNRQKLRQKNAFYNNGMFGSSYDNPMHYFMGHPGQVFQGPAGRGYKAGENNYYNYQNSNYYAGYNALPQAAYSCYDHYGAGGRYGAGYGYYSNQGYGNAQMYPGQNYWYPAAGGQRGQWGNKGPRGKRSATKV